MLPGQGDELQVLSHHCKPCRRLSQVRVIDDNKGRLVSGLHQDIGTSWLTGMPT